MNAPWLRRGNPLGVIEQLGALIQPWGVVVFLLGGTLAGLAWVLT